MLQLMRKHAGNWMIKILLAAIALAFGLSFGMSQFGPTQEVALTVNDEPVTQSQIAEEAARLTEQFRRMYGDKFDQIAKVVDIKEQATNAVIDRVLIFQAARQIGVMAGAAEVQARVASQEMFQKNGHFDLNLYRRLLAANRITPEQYEAAQADQIIMEKLSALVAGSAQASPLEIEQFLKQELAQVEGAYLLFMPAEFMDKVETTQKDLDTYYEAHKADFLIPAQIELSYMVFPAANYKSEVDVRPEDVADVYEMDRDRYRQPERVHASHILIKLAPDAAPEAVAQAEEKAKKILEEAKKPDADFAALAKQYSEGPTGPTGGDLGYFTRGQMVPQFEEVAFKLKPGEVDITRTDFGYHIIKVADHQEAKVTPIEEVRVQIEDQLTERQARYLAQAAAERAFDEANLGTTPQELAAKLGSQLVDSPASPVAGPIPGLEELKDLDIAVEGLEDGQVLPVMDYKDGSVLAFLKKRIPESVKPLDEVKDQVVKAVKEQKAAGAARQAAAEELAKLAKAGDPAKALTDNPEAKTTGWRGKGQGVEGLIPSHGLITALMLRPADKPVLDEPVGTGGGYAAAVLTGRKEPSAEKMDEKRKEYEVQFLSGKRQDLVQRFVKDLRSMAEIKVNSGGV